jgi:hypothetical protein
MLQPDESDLNSAVEERRFKRRVADNKNVGASAPVAPLGLKAKTRGLLKRGPERAALPRRRRRHHVFEREPKRKRPMLKHTTSSHQPQFKRKQARS